MGNAASIKPSTALQNIGQQTSNVGSVVGSIGSAASTNLGSASAASLSSMAASAVPIPDNARRWVQAGGQALQNFQGMGSTSAQKAVGTASQLMSQVGGGYARTNAIHPASLLPTVQAPTLTTTPKNTKDWVSVLSQYGLNESFAADNVQSSHDVFVGLNDDGSIVTVPLADINGLEWASTDHQTGLNYYYEPEMAQKLRARCPVNSVPRWPHNHSPMM